MLLSVLLVELNKRIYSADLLSRFNLLKYLFEVTKLTLFMSVERNGHLQAAVESSEFSAPPHWL